MNCTITDEFSQNRTCSFQVTWVRLISWPQPKCIIKNHLFSENHLKFHKWKTLETNKNSDDKTKPTSNYNKQFMANFDRHLLQLYLLSCYGNRPSKFRVKGWRTSNNSWFFHLMVNGWIISHNSGLDFPPMVKVWKIPINSGYSHPMVKWWRIFNNSGFFPHCQSWRIFNH